MTQLLAFMKKEWMEQLRTGKFMILLILFCLFGIMNPAIARLTPWLMDLLSEQLAQSGISAVGIEVDALTSWTQFFKNMPIMLIIYIVMFGGILTAECQNKTLINVITKGMKRWKILAAKILMMDLFWMLGCLVCYGITYSYNAYFWDNSIAQNVSFASLCFCLMGLWLLSIIPLASALLKSAYAVILSVGGAFLAAYVLSLFSKIKEYSPVCLIEVSQLMNGAGEAGDYALPLILTLFFIVINSMLAVFLFNRKNL